MLIYGKASGNTTTPLEDPQLNRDVEGRRVVPLYLMLLARQEAVPWCAHMRLYKYTIDGKTGAYKQLFKISTPERVALDLHADLEKLGPLTLADDIIDRSNLFA